MHVARHLYALWLSLSGAMEKPKSWPRALGNPVSCCIVHSHVYPVQDMEWISVQEGGIVPAVSDFQVNRGPGNEANRWSIITCRWGIPFSRMDNVY
jgi:hypothetical protein